MQKFLRTLMLAAAMLLPFASQAQNLNESFDGTAWPPDEWTAVNVSGTVSWGRYTSNTRNSSAACASVNYASNGHENYLITPQLAPVDGDTLTFYVSSQSYSGTTLTIEVSTASTATSDFTTTLATYTSGSSGTIGTTSISTYVEKKIDLSAYAGQQIYVAFHVVDNDGGRINLEDVSGPAIVLPSCSKVTDLAIDATQTTNNSLTLTWTDDRNSGATYSVYSVTPSGSTLVQSGISGTSYTVTGLVANTVYAFAVMTDCGGGDVSELTAPVSGRTACDATTPLPYSENFGGYTGLPSSPYTGPSVLPACWDYYGNGTNTAETTGSSYFGGVAQYNYTSSYACLVANDPYLCMPIQVTGSAVTSQTYLDYEAARGNTKFAVLPAFPTALNTLQISFDYKMYNSYSATGCATTLELGYITTDTSSFVSLQQYQAVSSVQHVVELSLATLAAAAPADARLAFKFSGVHNGTSSYSYSTDYCGLDNIVVEELPSCLRISNLTVAGVTASTATLTWSDPLNTGATYSVYIVTPSDTTLVVSGVSDTTYTVTDLDANTQYVFGVEANCSASDASPMNTASGRTACATEVMPWSENFDNWTAKSPCWSFLSGLLSEGNPTAYTSAWTLTNSYGDYIALSGKALGMNLYSDRRYWAVTPAISITSDNAVLSVDVAVAQWSAATPNYDDNDTLAFLATTDGGATWTVLQTYNGTQLNAFGNEYTTLIVPIPSDYYGMDVRFAIYGGSVSGTSPHDNRFVFDNVSVDEAPDCLPVAGLAVSDITIDSATLTWTGEANSYNVYVLTATDTTLVENVTDTTIILTGLTAMTSYTYGVRAVCSSSESDLVPITFRTACTAFALPYTEDFENGIDCWSLVSCHAGTQVVENDSYNTYAYSGTHAFKFRYNTNPPQYLISPEFTDVENGVQVSFMYKVGGNYTESFALGYSTTTNDVSAFTWLNEQTGLTNTTYASYTDYLPAGTKYVAVKYTANDQLSLYIDSMVFSPMSANFCYPVTGLTVDSTTGSSVTLSWTGDAASYSIYNGTAYVGSTTDTFYTVSGLTAVTTYTFGVTAVCSATDSADMVTVSATTGCAGESCLITVSGTDAYNDGWDGAMMTISQNGVTVGTFTVDAASNTATYSVCSGAPVTFSWTTSTYYESYPEDVSFTITDGGGATVHSLTDATNMTDGVFFTLADACPSCVAPVVTLDSVTTTTATISWTSTATSYDVYNGTTFVTNTTATTYTFTGLTAATSYTFGVQAICSATDSASIASVNVMTACADVTVLPYTEGFENGLGCWSTVNGSSDGMPWFTTNSSSSLIAHGGNAMAVSVSYYSGAMHANAWLISPKFVLPTINAGDSLNFGWWHKVSSNYPTELYDVMISTTTNDTAAFTTTLLAVNPDSTDDWVNNVVNLNAYAGQSVYIAFHHHDSYDQNYLLIDDVTLSVGAAPMPVPDTLTVTFAVENATMGTTVPAPGTYQYITGDTVRFQAVPNNGYHFSGWIMSANGQNDTLGAEYISAYVPANAIMSYGSMTLTALFEAGNPDSTTITYAVNDATMGSINPAGTQTIYVGNTIQAEATANAGYELYAWVLDILVNGVSANRDTIFSDEEDFANPMIFGTLPQSVVDDGATITITALFQASTVADTYTVTVNVNNAAMGSVTGAPTAPVAENTVVTLTAVANTGYRFVNWSNGLTNETISITVNSDTTLTANFEAIPTYTVTTVVNPANSGSITGAPTTAVLEGSEVVLTAVPAAGYHFVNWSNGSTTATIQVTVTSDTTLTANFEANAVGTYTVAVNYDATMGTVTGIPTEAVTSGTEVTLTATANTGFHFVSWSTGATTETITITVTSDTVLSATFEADEAELFTITVSSADETMGTVTGGGQFHAGDQTTVMAVANDGYRFVRWSDGNTEAVRQITVTGDLTLVAYFESIDGIDDVEAGNVSIYSAESRIFVKGAENSTIYVYDVNGRVVRTQANATETVEFTVPGTGVYLVKVGNAPAKRVVVVR